MIETIITNIKTKKQTITQSVIISLSLIQILNNPIPTTPEEKIKLIKDFCRNNEQYIEENTFKEWVFTDTLTSYNGEDINYNEILSSIAWLCNSEERLVDKYNDVISLLCNDDNLIRRYKKLVAIFYYLKKGYSKDELKEYISEEIYGKEIVNSFNLFYNTNSFIETLNKYIELQEENHFTSSLPCIFSYFYYKYIPYDLYNEMKVAILNKSYLNLYYPILEYIDDIEYYSVTQEFVLEDSKYIATKITYNNKVNIEFFHSKNIKSLTHYFVLNELMKTFNYSSEDAILDDYTNDKDFYSFFNYQLQYCNEQTYDEISKVKEACESILNTNSIEEIKNNITVLNEIIKNYEYELEFIYFDNPTQVINYIQRNYNDNVDIYCNLLKYCQKL